MPVEAQIRRGWRIVNPMVKLRDTGDGLLLLEGEVPAATDLRVSHQGGLTSTVRAADDGTLTIALARTPSVAPGFYDVLVADVASGHRVHCVAHVGK